MCIVQKLRCERGWSQEHLAGAAGISRATVQRIESGKVLPSKEVAQALAGALDCDAGQIRAASVLKLRVCRAMARINGGGRPGPKLMQRLPDDYRATFEEHCNARDEVCAANAAVIHATELFAAARERREQWMVRNLLALLSDQCQELENWAEDIGNQQQSALDAFLASSDRYQAALVNFGSTGKRVSALLLRFCA